MNDFRMLSKEVNGEVYSGAGECPTGNCPSILQRADGQIIVVGKRLSSEEIEKINASGLLKIHGDEFAVLVKPELIQMGMKEL